MEEFEGFHGWEQFGACVISPHAILPGPITAGDMCSDTRAKEISMIKTAPVGTRFNLPDGWYIQVRLSKKGIRVYRCHIVGGTYKWLDDSKLN